MNLLIITRYSVVPEKKKANNEYVLNFAINSANNMLDLILFMHNINNNFSFLTQNAKFIYAKNICIRKELKYKLP